MFPCLQHPTSTSGAYKAKDIHILSRFLVSRGRWGHGKCGGGAAGVGFEGLAG